MQSGLNLSVHHFSLKNKPEMLINIILIFQSNAVMLSEHRVQATNHSKTYFFPLSLLYGEMHSMCLANILAVVWLAWIIDRRPETPAACLFVCLFSTLSKQRERERNEKKKRWNGTEIAEGDGGEDAWRRRHRERKRKRKTSWEASGTKRQMKMKKMDRLRQKQKRRGTESTRAWSETSLRWKFKSEAASLDIEQMHQH